MLQSAYVGSDYENATRVETFLELRNEQSILPMAHHFRPDAARWRAQLDDAGFTVEEEGNQPVTLYWLARKK